MSEKMNNSQDPTALALVSYKQIDGCQSYHVMRKPTLIIGRNKISSSECHSKVDVDVGVFTRFASREHLRISHCVNESASHYVFTVEVLGKNGIFVDGDFFRTGQVVELPQKCFLRFPSTNVTVSFVSLLPPEVCRDAQSQEIWNSTIFSHDIGGELDDFRATSRLCATRPPSPSGTISALNSCPSSPRRGQYSIFSQNCTVNPNQCSSPLPIYSDKQLSRVVLYTGGGTIREANFDSAMLPYDCQRSQDMLQVDDTIVLDEELVWDPNDRDNSAIVARLLGGDEEVAASTSGNLFDIHDTAAQMPPLSDGESSEHDLIATRFNQRREDLSQNVGPVISDNINIECQHISSPERNYQETVSVSKNDAPSTKPNLSWVQLIATAISSSPMRQLPLKNIYEHISQNYAHFKMTDKGWQNSLRHTLSLSPYFERVRGAQGKGSVWILTEAYENRNSSDANTHQKRVRAAKRNCPDNLTSPSKQKAIAPAPSSQQINRPQIFPLTFLPESMPVVQPVTVLLQPGRNGETTYTVLHQQPQPQPQVIFLQCVQPQYTTVPSTSTNYVQISTPPTQTISSNNAAVSNISTSATRSSAKKPVLINEKKFFLTPVDVSPCGSSASFSSYFPK